MWTEGQGQYAGGGAGGDRDQRSRLPSPVRRSVREVVAVADWAEVRFVGWFVGRFGARGVLCFGSFPVALWGVLREVVPPLRQEEAAHRCRGRVAGPVAAEIVARGRTAPPSSRTAARNSPSIRVGPRRRSARRSPRAVWVLAIRWTGSASAAARSRPPATARRRSIIGGTNSVVVTLRGGRGPQRRLAYPRRLVPEGGGRPSWTTRPPPPSTSPRTRTPRPSPRSTYKPPAARAPSASRRSLSPPTTPNAPAFSPASTDCGSSRSSPSTPPPSSPPPDCSTPGAPGQPSTHSTPPTTAPTSLSACRYLLALTPELYEGTGVQAVHPTSRPPKWGRPTSQRRAANRCERPASTTGPSPRAGRPPPSRERAAHHARPAPARPGLGPTSPWRFLPGVSRRRLPVASGGGGSTQDARRRPALLHLMYRQFVPHGDVRGRGALKGSV